MGRQRDRRREQEIKGGWGLKIGHPERSDGGRDVDGRFKHTLTHTQNTIERMKKYEMLQSKSTLKFTQYSHAHTHTHSLA